MTELIPIQPHELTQAAGAQLDQNPAAVYLASLASEGSRRTQRAGLDAVARLVGAVDCLAIPWAAMRYQHTAAIRAQLMNRYKPATANRMLAALRGVLREAWRLGLMTAEDYRRAADVGNIRESSLPAGRGLSAGEIAALLQGCEADPSPAGARDGALIALLYGAGLRREEVVRLDLADYDPENGRLLIHGKGRKERETYLGGGAAAALADWLAVRGGDPGPLFWPIRKGGALTNRRMANQAIYNLLAKRAKLSGVASFSPHDLRRSFISDMLDAGADIATVAKMAGHASVTTTGRYDRRGEKAKQKAAGMLHVPYHGRG